MSDTPLIGEALEQVAIQCFLRAKMRLKEMGKSKAGNPKRDVTFDFEHNNHWYTMASAWMTSQANWNPWMNGGLLWASVASTRPTRSQSSTARLTVYSSRVN
ncbi:MAG: hypothetical protein ACJ8LM_15625 [Candidatus Udaeobacter sp.]